ncbi:MAG TPA: AMP-binding protein, partial [Acetobacteraceae bacterium]
MSYVSGVSSAPHLGETIGQRLDSVVARWGDRTALVVRQQRVSWSWRELDARAEAFAAGLLSLGLIPGDRIGIWSQNNAEWVLTMFAAAKAGLVLVTINPAYRVSELEYALNKVGCRALVSATTFKTSDYAAMLMSLAPELANCPPGRLAAEKLLHLEIVIQIGAATIPGALTFADVSALGTPATLETLRAIGASLQFDAPVNVQFTSGTTGSPKGAALTHHNILNNGYFVAEAMRLTEHDRLCIPVPLYHCFGMVMGVLGCLTHGTTMVFSGEGFDPLATLETVAAERCTGL